MNRFLPYTYIGFRLFLAKIEIDHSRYGIHIDQKVAFFIPHLGKLEQEGEVLGQELTMGSNTMFQLELNQKQK